MIYLTNLYCPFCGNQAVLVDTSINDYYEGHNFKCNQCSELFTLPCWDYYDHKEECKKDEK